jgi:hypothetical protein
VATPASTRSAAYHRAAELLTALCWHEDATDWAGALAGHMLHLTDGAAIHAPAEAFLRRIATYPNGGGPAVAPTGATVRADIAADLDLAARSVTPEALEILVSVAEALIVAWDAHSDSPEVATLHRVVRGGR